MTENIYVTKSFIHDTDTIAHKISKILQSGQLTNNGTQLKLLETELIQYLQIPHISLFCNGTIALLMGLKAMALTGEVITTPFTFPATIHALEWLGLTPVFCDIDEETMCIDADKIEALITPKTSAILGVHVYGMACDIAKIQTIADKHQLKVIYDAAHCFITQLNGKSIAHYGDMVMFSFHATKLFNTVEGGALICRDDEIMKKLRLIKNFGILAENEIICSGLNGKMSELHAAVGRENLKNLHHEIAKRKEVFACYQQHLQDTLHIKLLTYPDRLTPSLQYYPIRFMVEEMREKAYIALQENNIFARKYFYPLCSNYPCYQHLPSAKPKDLPIANHVVEQVLCLPFYGDLSANNIEKICFIVKNT